MDIILKNHPLFKNIVEDDISKLISCLDIYEKDYLKNEYIILVNNKIDFIGIVVHGTIFMEQEDYYGDKFFFTSLPKNNLFGEIFISWDVLDCSVNYRAATDCSIIFIKYATILNSCSKGCDCHKQLIENLVNLMALKSRNLIEKIEIISKKTLRERILSYLKILSKKQNSNRVTSNLNHTELADFLCVNRSSMLRELKKMKSEKIIDYNKNVYILKKTC